MNALRSVLVLAVIVLGFSLVGCARDSAGRTYYAGPPVTVSVDYTKDNAKIGASVHLDPSFAQQKK